MSGIIMVFQIRIQCLSSLAFYEHEEMKSDINQAINEALSLISTLIEFPLILFKTENKCNLHII